MGNNYEEEEYSDVVFKAFLMTFQKFVENADTKEEVMDYLKELIKETEK